MRSCFFVLFFIKGILAGPFYEDLVAFEGKKSTLLGHFKRVFSEILEEGELSSEEAAMKNLCEILNIQIPNIPTEPVVGVEKDLRSLVPFVEKYISQKATDSWSRGLWRAGVRFSLKNIEILSWRVFFETLLFSFQDIKPMFKKGPILRVFDERLVTLTEVFEVFKAWQAHKIIHLACVQVFETIDEEHVKIKTNEFDGVLEKRIRSYLLGAEDYLDPKTFTARTCVSNSLWAQGIISQYINEWSLSESKADLLRRIRHLNEEITIVF